MENPFEQFVFGRQTSSGPAAAAATKPQRPARSHSRSGSISQSISELAAQAPAAPMPRSRPTSTHKRHSSVSNRRESAELMGIALPPEDPAKDGQDPVLRALLALEGNRSAGSSPRNSFTNRAQQVQIPDFDALANADNAEPRRPAVLPLNSSLAGKRDSFGKLLTPASTIHMELGTLIEEEEEEDDSPAPVQPAQAVRAPALAAVTPHVLKARPHNLDLRALTVSTAPAVVTPVTSSIPTPASTPSPRLSGLRSLTLSSSPLINSSPLSGGVRLSSTSSPAKTLNRKSSISYKRPDSADGPRSPSVSQVAYTRPTLLPSLMTPEHTPTSSGSEPGTPAEMSPSRRTFIYQSHAALVSRVSELERLLATQSPSLSPISTTSDEFLALITDLKAERDTLKRDMESWRNRVSDLEKQNSTLSKRIETERRDAWVLREKLGVLQIEKSGLDNDHKKLKDTTDGLENQVSTLQAQLDEMRRERDDARHALDMASRSRTTLHPTKPGSYSIDSLNSATDVDSVPSQRSSLIAGLASKLKAVEEEDDNVDYYREPVSHYEDDSDASFYTRSRPNSECSVALSIEPASPVSEDEHHMRHTRHDTLSRGWNFAKASSTPRLERQPATVDHFFGCLEDPDTSADEITMMPPSSRFGGFGAPLGDDEDDMPPFVLPTQHGAQAKFTVVDDSDDEDDGMNFVIPVKAVEPKVSLKSAPMPFAFPRRVLSKPSQAAPLAPQVFKARSIVPPKRW